MSPKEPHRRCSPSFSHFEVIVVLRFNILFLNILRYDLICYGSTRRCKVSSRPKMSAPELLVQPAILSLQAVRCLTFDRLHYSARRQIRRYSQQQVNMIRPNVSLHYLYVVAPAYFSYQLTKSFPDFSGENWLAVFRYENEMAMKTMHCV